MNDPSWMTITKKVMEQFMDFMKGTDGHKYYSYWMDVENAKLQNQLTDRQGYSR